MNETPQLTNNQVKSTNLNPVFQPLNRPETFINHLDESKKSPKAINHDIILSELKDQVAPVDFEALAFPQLKGLREKAARLEQIINDTDGNAKKELEEFKAVSKKIAVCRLNSKHFLILPIEEILKIAKLNKWNICKNLDFIYIYNGAYWKVIDKETFQQFLGEAAEKMGVPKYEARFFLYRESLFKQFLSTGYLPTPEPDNDSVLINLLNGTLEITAKGTRLIRFNPDHFLTYQLPFEYNPEVNALIWQKFLNRVLPDAQSQNILAEYLGFIFIKNGSTTLKEEKALILHGTGANGKSVVYEVVNALLGNENVSSYSLQSLTNENGYYRAKIANKLVNYASEITGQLETSLFKQMTSGEPIEARLPYGQPMQLTQYAKLIFNANELPREVEHTNAYFRRFLIIPFVVTIPEAEQDKQLHSKIIERELSGVLNWVLDGLNRLLTQKRFSACEAAQMARETYERQSDTVQMFLDENEYQKSTTSQIFLKSIYDEYRVYCLDDGFKPLNKMNFRKRLERLNIVIERNMYGNMVFVSKLVNTPL